MTRIKHRRNAPPRYRHICKDCGRYHYHFEYADCATAERHRRKGERVR